MPGGHPRLYKTPEERVLAARSYRAKYYECHRDQINRKIMDKRQKQKSANLSPLITQPVVLIGKPRASSLLSRQAGHPSIKPPTEHSKVAASHPEISSSP
ncbi:hypothetical protein BDN67DRAFT_1017213 [Paxillus ammoniavirescens]|nr:hypothetical protein BDN67DRAFT_1017213 [Paxillus ammoniavirescens]